MKKLVPLLFAALLLWSCGGDEEEPIQLECGEGTVLVDAECVVTARECPDGQVITPTGACRSPEIFCGVGAAYDTATESCVSTSEIRCGEGTVESGGRCVVAEPLSCGSGTVLADGECLLAEDACGPGTGLDELQCLPDDGACASGTQFDVVLRECVDLEVVECGENTTQVSNSCVPVGGLAAELAADADVDFSDANRTLSPGSSVGDQVIFTGTMSSSSLFHTFPLTVEEGQWLEIRLYPNGIPSVGFRVNHPVSSWERVKPAGISNVATRQIRARANTLDLIVNTYVSGLSGLGPFSTTGWSYVGVVEVIDPPHESHTWELGNDLELSLGSPQLVEIELPPGARAVIGTDSVGADLDNARLEVWELSSFSTSYTLAPGEVAILDGDPSQTVTRQLVIDARTISGAQDQITLTSLQAISIPSGQFTEQVVTAQAGDLLRLGHVDDDGMTLGLEVRQGDEVLFETSSAYAENRSSFSLNQVRREFFHVPADGEYTVRHINSTGSAVTGFFTNFSVEEPPRFSIADQGISDFDETLAALNLPLGDWRFVLIDAPSAAFVDASFSAGSGTLHATVYDAERKVVVDDTSTGTSAGFEFDLLEEGTYVLALKSGSSFTNLSGGINVEMQANPSSSLEPGDSLTEIFDVAVFDVLRGSASYRAGDARLRLLNPLGEPVFDDVLSGSVQLLELFPATGTFTLELINDGDEPLLDPFLDVEHLTPFTTLDRSGEFQEVIERDGPLQEGDREYVLLRVQTGTLLEAHVDQAATLTWEGQSIPGQVSSESGDEEVLFDLGSVSPGVYVLGIEAGEDLPTGYTLTLNGEVTTFGSVSVTSTPALAIPDNVSAGVDDQIQVSGCSEVVEIDMDIDITHTFRGDLRIELTNPAGETIILKNRFGFSADDIIGNFNETLGANGTSAEPIDTFVGSVGNGTWTLNVSDNASFDTGTLNSWTLNLFCAL